MGRWLKVKQIQTPKTGKPAPPWLILLDWPLHRQATNLTRAANSSNKAAYKNGSTARAAVNIATSIIPKGTNILPALETNTTANQKPARRNIVTNKGRSLLSKTNRRPKTKKVSLTVKVHGPTWTSSVIGSFQAIPAKNNITPVPATTVSR